MFIPNIAHERAIDETLRDLSSLVASSLRHESGIATEIFNIKNSKRLVLETFVCQSLHSLQSVLLLPFQTVLLRF